MVLPKKKLSFEEELIASKEKRNATKTKGKEENNRSSDCGGNLCCQQN